MIRTFRELFVMVGVVVPHLDAEKQYLIIPTLTTLFVDEAIPLS